MKWMLTAMVCLVLSPVGLAALEVAGETPPQQAASSDQEKNIRTDIELLRTDVRKQKSQMMSTLMQLDSKESAVFWPIYKNFETDLAHSGEGTVAAIKKYAENYGSMTNAVADELATTLLSLEQERSGIKRKYYEKFKTALNPIIAARFLQIENQLERVIDLQIASELPVIVGPPSGR
jgi:hypothetical protein